MVFNMFKIKYIIFICLWLAGAGTTLAQEAQPELTEFTDDILYTEPVDFGDKPGPQALEIVITLWGGEEDGQSIELSIEKAPSFIINPSWSTGSRVSFKAKEFEKTATLTFDLGPGPKQEKSKGDKTSAKDDKEKIKSEDLIIVLKASSKEIIPRERRIVLPIKTPPPEEKDEDKGEEEPAIVALSDAPMVLRLVKVSGPVLSEDSKKDDCRLTRSGGAGAVKTCGVAPLGGNAISAGLTRFPTEIVLGQPFEVELSYKWASSRRNFKPCEEQEFKDDKGRANCFFLWAYFRSGRGKIIGDTRISLLPGDDNSAKGTVKFIPEKCTARYPDNLPCDHPDIIATMVKGKHEGRQYTYRIESSDPDQYGDTTKFFHSAAMPVNKEGFVIPMTKENSRYERYKHQDKTDAELKNINSIYGYQLRLHFSSDELVTAYYMPVPVGGDYLKSSTPYSHSGKISAPKAIPEYLYLVMEIKGGGYDIYPGKKAKSVGGRRIEGWARSSLYVKWGEDPIKKAKERYKYWFSPVPSCIKKFSRAGGRVEIWDTGPQIRILSVGPYLNGAELEKAKAAGEFETGEKWEYIDSDQKEWENWRCEE